MQIALFIAISIPLSLKGQNVNPVEADSATIANLEQKPPPFDPYPPVKKEDLKKSFFRAFLNKITVNAYLGYGRTFYRQNLNNYVLYRSSGNLFITPATDAGGFNGNSFSNWLTFPRIDSIANPGTAEFATHPDSVNVGLRGSGGSVPIGVSLHYEFSRYRLGVGFAMEPSTLNRMRPREFDEQLGDYEPDFGMVNFKRFYVYGGGTVLSFPFVRVVADAHIGKVFMPNRKFDPLYRRNGLYFNLGATVEKRFSEYFRAYVRPSFEFKNYQMNGQGLAVKTSQNAFMLHFGVMINYPLFPRCPINSRAVPPNRSCKVQVEHIHGGGGKIYRGQPLHKWQNPKAGQNHRQLWRYKWQNRNDLTPY